MEAAVALRIEVVSTSKPPRDHATRHIYAVGPQTTRDEEEISELTAQMKADGARGGI